MKLLDLLTHGTICAALLAATGFVQADDTVTMPVVLKPISSTFSAPARVQPVSNIALTATTAGVVSGLHVGPGESVRRGEVVARLTGPTVTSERTRVNSESKSAEARLSAATQTASIEQQKFDEHLSARDNVSRARADMVAAREQFESAKAAATAYDAVSSIAVQDDGVVAAVSVSNGQFVTAGQALVSVAPLNGLHVVATLYGDDVSAVSIGKNGFYVPDGLNKPVNVRIDRLSWNPSVAGQLEVWLVPAGRETLVSGTAGTVTFGSAQEKHPAVPSSSLILDGGQWWVLVHEAGGNRRRHVAPGPAEAGWTVIRGGLNVGERVVTQDAYLLFHADFARRYQQAD